MDIFHEWAPVALAGAGWYSKERSPEGDLFRWATDGAWLDIAQLPGLAYDVTFHIEPGPAVGLKPFDLAIYEEGKRKLASLEVPGRERVTFRLPPGEPRVHHLELRPENGEKPVEAPGDTRTLRYRVFSLEITPVPDVSHLEEQIEERDAQNDVLQGRVDELESEAATNAEQYTAAITQLQREVDVRDAIIDRLEQTIGRLRSEIEELQRVTEGHHTELESVRALAEERLAVIRAIHDQGQRAAT